MKIRELASSWGKASAVETIEKTYTLSVPVSLAAKIAALSEMYQQTENEILNDLLIAALAEVESSMPYVKGKKVIGEDECGDPIFEDIGPTPRFIELSRKHLGHLRKSMLT
ncbi:MAG TPA: pilin assembly protein [Pseudomonadales bacterium]|nr:pilin assembly protein [Pseudomonadales bacterium]